MTLDELGEQWKENSAGSWGSSEQARLRLAQGVKGSETGHPRYNKLWFTIGPQFSADIYGLLAPGDVNLAGRLARTYGRINGHAEAVDGAVFVAGMVSLAFRTTDVEGRRAGRRAADSPLVAIPPGPRPRDRDGRRGAIAGRDLPGDRRPLAHRVPGHQQRRRERRRSSRRASGSARAIS